MTHLEAIQAVEDLATALELKDRWGDPIEGIAAVSQIAKLLPDETYAFECKFFGREIDPKQYVEGMKEVMNRFTQIRFAMRLEQRLAALKAGA